MDESIVLDEVESVAETTSSGKARRDFSLDEEIALCNEIEEKRPMFNSVRSGWKDVKTAMDTFNAFEREVRCYKLHYDKLLKKFQADDKKARWKSGSAEDVTNLKLCLANLVALQRDADMENAAAEDKPSPSTCARPASAYALKKKRLVEDNEKGKEIRQKAMEIYSKKRASNDVSHVDDSSAESDSSTESFGKAKKKKKKVDIEAAIVRKWKWESKLEERRIKLEEDKLELQRKELEIREKELSAGRNVTQTMA